MMLLLGSTISGHKFIIETEELLFDDSAIADYCFDELEKLVYDIVDNCHVTIKLPFSETDIIESIIEQASHDAKLSLLSFSKENGKTTGQIEISISSYLQERIDEITSSGDFNACVSKYVEKTLMDFVEQSC